MAKVAIVVAVVVIVLLIVVMTIALIATSLRKLDSHEVGVKYDIYKKNLADEMDEEGLHTGPPGFKFIKFPRIFETFDFPDVDCLNKDGVTMELHVTYQYRPRHDNLTDIIREFRDYDRYKSMLKLTGNSVIQDICATFSTSDFQTARGDFQQKARDKMADKYDAIRCDVIELQVNDIRRPRLYDEMIQTKEMAREDINVAQNEGPRQMTEANTRRQMARRQGAISIDKAESDRRIAEHKSEYDARVVENAWRREAATYKRVMDTLEQSAEEFLAYMGVRNMQAATQTVHVAVKPPAETSYATTL